jgi:uncharacterized protein (DUF2249 family)
VRGGAVNMQICPRIEAEAGDMMQLVSDHTPFYLRGTMDKESRV